MKNKNAILECEAKVSISGAKRKYTANTFKL